MRHNAHMLLARSVLLFACASLCAQQHYTISTLAGGTASSFFYNPTSVAIDLAGNVFVADWTGLIRKIWALDHSVTTFAGTGTEGFSGDRSPATSAMIGRGHITLDNAGNLYLADVYNGRIRRIDVSTGIITTIAGTGAPGDSGDGGFAIAAGISGPNGIIFDNAGNLFFGNGGSRVRTITAHLGAISTVAGQAVSGFSGDGGLATSAKFAGPTPGAVDHAGNIFIADYQNSRIRKITPGAGIVTTIAGASPCSLFGVAPFIVTGCPGGFSGDGGPATSALLHHPGALVFDNSGNLYIADSLNYRIRRVDAATGIITTIAGTGVNGFSGDGGPALAAQISAPAGIAIDYAGRIYFADQGNQRVRVLTPAVGRQSWPRQLPRSVSPRVR